MSNFCSMVDHKVIDWIQSEEAEGFNEKQLKGALKDQGYNNKDIEEAILASRPPNKLIKKSLTYMVVFYITLVLSIFELIGILSFAIYSKLNMMIITGLIVWTIALAILTVRHKFFAAMFMMFFQLSFLYLVIMQITLIINLPHIITYFLIAILSAVFGVWGWYMFRSVIYGVILSCFMTLMFSISHGISFVVKGIEAALASNPLGSFLLLVFNTNLPDPAIGYAIALILFNTGFIIDGIIKKKYNRLPLYILPILLYFALNLIFINVAKMFLQTF